MTFKNLLCNSGDTGSVPGQWTRTPRAMGQLSPNTRTTEPTHHNSSPKAPSKLPRDTTKILPTATETQHNQINKCFLKFLWILIPGLFLHPGVCTDQFGNPKPPNLSLGSWVALWVGKPLVLHTLCLNSAKKLIDRRVRIQTRVLEFPPHHPHQAASSTWVEVVVCNMDHDSLATGPISTGKNKKQGIPSVQHSMLSFLSLELITSKDLGSYYFLEERNQGSVKTLGHAVFISIPQNFTDGQ